MCENMVSTARDREMSLRVEVPGGGTVLWREGGGRPSVLPSVRPSFLPHPYLLPSFLPFQA